MALDPKFVRTARLIPLPLVRSGNISDTISQLIGPNEIWFPRTKQLNQEDTTIKRRKLSFLFLFLYDLDKS